MPINVIASFDPKLKAHTYEIIAYTMYTTGDTSLGPGDALLVPNKYVPNVTSELNAVWEREAARAEKHASEPLLSRFIWLYEQAKSGGPWDLKSKLEWNYNHFVYGDMVIERDVPGNILFGYAGTALGIPRQLLLGGAGAYQILSGTSYIGWYASWFDDPRDQEWIEFGIKMYQHVRSWREMIL